MVISSSLGIGIGIGVRFSNPILIGAPKMQRSRPLVRAGAGKWGVSDDVLARLSSELSEEYLASRRVPTPPKLWHKREQLGMNGDGSHFRYRCPNVNHFRVFLKPLTSTGSTSVDVDLIIRYYIQTLSQLLGSEEEAVKRIYSVATNEYYAFGANISAKLADIMIALPNVCNIHPDEYVDRREKRFPYPWYPFINGQVVPYDRSDFLNYGSHGLWMVSQETLPNSCEEAIEELGMTSHETLPSRFEEANVALGIASQEILPNRYGEANVELGMASQETLPNSYEETAQMEDVSELA